MDTVSWPDSTQPRDRIDLSARQPALAAGLRHRVHPVEMRLEAFLTPLHQPQRKDLNKDRGNQAGKYGYADNQNDVRHGYPIRLIPAETGHPPVFAAGGSPGAGEQTLSKIGQISRLWQNLEAITEALAVNPPCERRLSANPRRLTRRTASFALGTARQELPTRPSAGLERDGWGGRPPRDPLQRQSPEPVSLCVSGRRDPCPWAGRPASRSAALRLPEGPVAAPPPAARR